MKRLIIVPVLILCLSSATSPAQETARADEIFAWFPQGTYMMIKHYDAELFTKGKAYPLYQEYFESTPGEDNKSDDAEQGGLKIRRKDAGPNILRVGEGDVQLNHLPPSLREGVYSSTTARPLTLADAPEDAPEMKEMVLTSPEGEPENTIKGIVVMQYTSMEVHRYHDLDGAVKTALKTGEINDTGRKIARRPVYSLASRPGDDRSSSLYAWAAETQELLVASSIDHLRKMVLTGHGRMMNMLDDPDLVDLPGLVPDLGAHWSIFSFKHSLQHFTEMMEERTISDEKAERMENQKENSPLYSIKAWKVDDEIVNQEIRVFDDSGKAEEALKRNPGGTSFSGSTKEFAQYNASLAQRQKNERHGNIVISTVVYDRDLLEQEKSAMESLAAGGGRAVLSTNDGTVTVIKAQKIELEKKKKKDK